MKKIMFTLMFLTFMSGGIAKANFVLEPYIGTSTRHEQVDINAGFKTTVEHSNFFIGPDLQYQFYRESVILSAIAGGRFKNFPLKLWVGYGFLDRVEAYDDSSRHLQGKSYKVGLGFGKGLTFDGEMIMHKYDDKGLLSKPDEYTFLFAVGIQLAPFCICKE